MKRVDGILAVCNNNSDLPPLTTNPAAGMHSYHQLANLQRTLAQHAAPQTVEQAVLLMAEAVTHAFQPVRALFCLDPAVVDAVLQAGQACPARRLVGELYLCQPDQAPDSTFALSTAHPYASPIASAGRPPQGQLLVELPGREPDAVEQVLLDLIATQLAHHLQHLASSPSTDPNTPHFDEATKTLHLLQRELTLTPQEFTFLRYLLRTNPQPATRTALTQAVYHHEQATIAEREDRLDVLVSKLRAKLRPLWGPVFQIQTVRGVGYRLRLKTDADLPKRER